MYKIIAHEGEVSYGIKEFAVDTAAEISNLPPCDMGSTAIAIAEGKVFMKNSKGEWVEL